MTVWRWAAAVSVLLLAAACLLPVIATLAISYSAFPNVDLDFLYSTIELLVSAVGGALLIVSIRMLREARDVSA